jgi:hypothetical protein
MTTIACFLCHVGLAGSNDAWVPYPLPRSDQNTVPAPALAPPFIYLPIVESPPHLFDLCAPR